MISGRSARLNIGAVPTKWRASTKSGACLRMLVCTAKLCRIRPCQRTAGRQDRHRLRRTFDDASGAVIGSSITGRHQLPRRRAMTNVRVILPRRGAVMPVIAGCRSNRRWYGGRGGRCDASGLRQCRNRQTGDRQQSDRCNPVATAIASFVMATRRGLSIIRVILWRRSLILEGRRWRCRMSMREVRIVVLVLGESWGVHPQGKGKRKTAGGFDRFHTSNNDGAQPTMTANGRSLQPFVTRRGGKIQHCLSEDK